MAGIFSVGLLAAVITLSVLLSQCDSAVIRNECTTKECIKAANLILQNIDETVDPCEDFNRFSCGNFIKTRPIAEDQSSADTFGDLRNTLALNVAEVLSEPIGVNDTVSTENAKIFYKSCLNESKLEEIGEQEMLDVINELDGWNLLDSSKPVTSETLFKKLVKLRKIEQSPLFSVYISANPKTPDRYVLRLQQPTWLAAKERYTDQKYIDAYKSLTATTITYLQAKNNITINQTVLLDQINKMFDLEKSLAMSQLDVAERRNQTYVNKTIADLTCEYPSFEWSKYIIDGMFGDSKITPKVGKDEPILVVDQRYLTNFSMIYKNILASEDEMRNLDNLLGWYFMKTRLSYLPKKYRDAQQEFEKVSSGVISVPPRSRTCANSISDRMPFSVGRLYVEKYFDEKAKIAAEEMIKSIQKEFIELLGPNDWMDQESKTKAKEKAELIDVKVGYPDFTYNDTYLDIYENYTFNINTLLRNALTVQETDFNKTLREFRDKRDTKEWISGSAIVNAFYSSTNNQITFPAGILQAPFYDAKVPKYLNYGGIGMVIGHEITHGFDDNGRKYDKNGVFFADGEVGLWSETTVMNYNVKAKCIIDQYSNFTATQVGMNLRGQQTQGENIADNGGLKESFGAYIKWVQQNGAEELLPGLNYTQEQLFFINNAQVWCSKFTNETLINRIRTGVHSPGEFRIRGPTSNSPDFSKAFQCKQGAGNNPVKKCAVW